MRFLASLLFSVWMVVSACVCATAIVVCAFASRQRRFRLVQIWASGIVGALKLLCGLNHVVEGEEHIPSGPAVVMLKHASAWETIVEVLVFPLQTWVLKRELIWIPLIGWAIGLLGAIPINRKGKTGAVRQVIEKGTQRLDAGMNVMIFPEGTRVPPGSERRYGRSGAMLAVSAGRPVVPVAHNAGDYWPRRRVSKRPGTIRMCIGPPIETDGKDAETVNAEVKRWIDAKMREISPAYQTTAQGDRQAVAAKRVETSRSTS